MGAKVGNDFTFLMLDLRFRSSILEGPEAYCLNLKLLNF